MAALSDLGKYTLLNIKSGPGVITELLTAKSNLTLVASLVSVQLAFNNAQVLHCVLSYVLDLPRRRVNLAKYTVKLRAFVSAVLFPRSIFAPELAVNLEFLYC